MEIHEGSGHIAKEAREAGKTEAEVVEQRRKAVPIGRFVQPEDIAALALFLCSPHASAITGESIAVDGGISTAVCY